MTSDYHFGIFTVFLQVFSEVQSFFPQEFHLPSLVNMVAMMQLNNCWKWCKWSFEWNSLFTFC